MRLFSRVKPRFSQLWGMGFILMLLAVACGTAATATPVPSQTAVPTPATGPKAAPTVAPQPTAAVPRAPVVNPGKVTWMVGSLGNERFDRVFAVAQGNEYGRQIHSSLISSDVNDGRRVMVPGIATKWEISSDGLTWTFTIRRGVRFHDGTEVTAEDVLWTLLHIMGPQTNDYATTPESLVAIMDRIEQAGPDRVSVTTKAPAPDFPATISEAGSGWYAILPKRATLHDVQEEAAYDRNPIGAGFMKLEKHVPTSVMKFERFEDFYYQPKNGFPEDKRVNFQSLDLFLAPEESTRVAAIRAGEADIAPVSLASRQQVEAGGGHLVFGKEGVKLDLRQYGCWKPQFPCHDKRVRQALHYAIDKKIIQNQLYGGPELMQLKGWFNITPSTIGYSPELDPFPFDPAKARQLLAEAGYSGGKGFGKLVINTLVSTSAPLLPESAQLGAGDWRKELGLDVEVKVWDAAALSKTVSLTEDLYGQIYWRANQTELDASRLLRKFYADPEQKSRRHDDPELLALTGKALAVFDSVEREQALTDP